MIRKCEWCGKYLNNNLQQFCNKKCEKEFDEGIKGLKKLREREKNSIRWSKCIFPIPENLKGDPKLKNGYGELTKI